MFKITRERERVVPPSSLLSAETVQLESDDSEESRSMRRHGMTDERRTSMDAVAFGQMYIYWPVPPAVKPRRRQPTREGDIRKIFIDLRGRENKRSFWELASYDDLSARFNGVSSTLPSRCWPSIREAAASSSMYSFSSELASLRRATNLWPFLILFHSLRAHRARRKEIYIYIYIDFSGNSRSVKDTRVGSLRVYTVYTDKFEIKKQLSDSGIGRQA